MSNNKGISHLLILVVILFVGVVGFAGWRVYTSENNKNNQTSNQPAPTVKQDEVQNAEDVNKLKKEAESTNIEGDLDSSELDTDLNELQ